MNFCNLDFYELTWREKENFFIGFSLTNVLLIGGLTANLRRLFFHLVQSLTRSRYAISIKQRALKSLTLNFYFENAYKFKTNLTVQGVPNSTYVIDLPRNKSPPLFWDWVLALYMRCRFYVWGSLKSSLSQI